jgi:amino acid transporter
MAFLFIWQFILSGPLEIASGYIGFKNYLGYLWPELAKSQALGNLVIIAVGLVSLWLLYRKITHIGKITVSLWIGTLITMAAVIVTGAIHFDAQKAFDFPGGSFQFSLGFLLGLGAASRVGVYDYLGYYDICYIGEEVKNPGRVIPRSILISVVAVAMSYFAINISLIGVLPWREFVPYETTKPTSDFVVSIFMERTCGPAAAKAFTVLVLWTALGSIFALLLGYSRIPYAAARDGYFFKVFARLHPTKNFPHVSLLVVAVVSILCSFWDIGMVIDAMLVTRILIQFIGQVFAVMLLRRRAPGLHRPYRIWLYPFPAFVALAGWVFLFATSSPFLLELGLGSLFLGVPVFLFWSWLSSGWPFAPARPSPATGSPGSESPSSGSGDKSRSG